MTEANKRIVNRDELDVEFLDIGIAQRAVIYEAGKPCRKSHASIYTYSKNRTYPADVCTTIERTTNGEITAVFLRPDIFTPTKAHENLANGLLNSYEKLINTNNLNVVIYQLNYIQDQAPALYKKVLEHMCKTAVGRQLMNQRIAHQSNGY